MGIQINGNTNNINAGIGSLSIEDIRELDIIGVATASNFKTGVSNLHSVGLTLSGGQLDVGSNIKIGTAGVITATSLRVGGLDSDIANSSADEAIFGRTDSGDTGITIFTGSGSTGRIYFGDGHGSAADRAGTINYSHTTNDMSFGTSGNNERFRITSTGQIKIKGQSGYTGFYLSNAYGQAGIFGGMYYNGSAWVRDAEGTRRGAGMYVNTNGSIVFLKSTETSGTSATMSESGRIDQDGNVLIGTTSSTVYDDTSGSGVVVRGSTGAVDIMRNNDHPLLLNRTGGDGVFLRMNRDGVNKSDISIRSNALCFDVGGSERVQIDNTGKVRFAVTNVQIELKTSDGSDNGYLNFSGGGACSQGRGAQIVLNGNERSSHQGRLQLLAGQSGNANGVIDFYTSGSKKATINDSGCLHIGNVGYGDKNYMLDVEGGIACEGTGGGTGRYGTIYSNFGGDSGGRQCGSYTIHGGQMSMHGTGNRYMHIKFDMPGGAMWYMKIEGYEYNGNWTSTVNGTTVSSDKVHYSLSGGYIYSGQALFNGKAKAHRGVTPTWYLHGNDLCVYIDTNSTGTGNRWGFYRFSGGHDGIVGRSSAQPIAIVAYSFSSGTSNPF